MRNCTKGRCSAICKEIKFNPQRCSSPIVSNVMFSSCRDNFSNSRASVHSLLTEILKKLLTRIIFLKREIFICIILVPPAPIFEQYTNMEIKTFYLILFSVCKTVNDFL